MLDTPMPPAPGAVSETAHTEPQWIFTKEEIANTPSRQDGVSLEEECQQRKEFTKLITLVGSAMEGSRGAVRVSLTAINAGKIFFNRFFMVQSLKKHNPRVKIPARGPRRGLARIAQIRHRPSAHLLLCLGSWRAEPALSARSLLRLHVCGLGASRRSACSR